MALSKPHAQFEVVVPDEMREVMRGGGAIAPRVSRSEALQVPAVLRSRNLIAGTLSTLPVHVYDKTNREVHSPFFEQIDPDIPNVVTYAQTYEDLLFEGVSWWRIQSFQWNGYPAHASHVPITSVFVAPTGDLPSTARVSADQPFPASGRVYIDGRHVPDEEIIRFDSPNPPLLTHAARAIRTCLTLDRTASRYADEPMPLGVFTPKSGEDDASDEEIQEMLDAWERARLTRAWGYVNSSVDVNVMQFNAEQIQLAEQRNHAVLEISRAAGIDPEDLGVSTTSRTYANAEQRRLDLLDFTLKSYVSSVEQRLSMRDVLPRGQRSRVNLDSFLRSDTKTRMETYKLGLETGAITEDEIRDLEKRPPLTAAQKTQRTEAQQPEEAANV